MFRQKKRVVKTGDYLYKIARKNRILCWPNLYFASEDNAIRNKHQNPDMICPGVMVVIPPLLSIAPMEIRPKIIYHEIPLFTQSLDICWKAIGKMLFVYKNPGINAEIKFDITVRDRYKNMAVGLP